MRVRPFPGLLLAALCLAVLPHDACTEPAPQAVAREMARIEHGPAAETIAEAEAEAFGEGHGEGHGENAGGLPQLDPRHFPGQAFWLVITFALTFVMMQFVAAPQVQRTLDRRQRRIETDLENARLLNEEAKRLSGELELRMNEARTRAQDQIRDAAQAAANRLSAALEEQQKVIDKKLAAAETSLNATREQALAALDDDGSVVLDALLKRLGTPMDKDQALKAWQMAKDAQA